MDNPETKATLCTQNTRRRQTKKNHNTICIGHQYTQANTNNVNKTWGSLQTTVDKDVHKNVSNFNMVTVRLILEKRHIKYEFKNLCSLVAFGNQEFTRGAINRTAKVCCSGASGGDVVFWSSLQTSREGYWVLRYS